MTEPAKEANANANNTKIVKTSLDRVSFSLRDLVGINGMSVGSIASSTDFVLLRDRISCSEATSVEAVRRGGNVILKNA
jgi:hypothetical protein